jgi:hypothetical protein
VAAGLQLTPAATLAAGSAFWPHPVPTTALNVSFSAVIGAGTGADGLTFALADASRTRLPALGTPGSGLGFAGVPGLAVALETYPSTGNESANSIGLVAGVDGGGGLRWSEIDGAIPPLRGPPVLVSLQVRGNTVSVSVGGFAAFTLSAPVPKIAYLGFTAATGARTDVHRVSQVAIAAPRGPASRAHVAAAVRGGQRSASFGSVAVRRLP